MKTRRWKRFAAVVLNAALLTALLLGWTALARSKSDVQADSAELEGVLRLRSEIEALRDRPRRAESTELQLDALTRRIEEACKVAGIGTDRLLRIEPQATRRLADAPYREKPTRVEIHRSTLKEIVTFLHRLSAERHGLHVKDLRLRAPHGEDVGEDWLLEVTLSYLIYTPPGAN